MLELSGRELKHEVNQRAEPAATRMELRARVKKYDTCLLIKLTEVKAELGQKEQARSKPNRAASSL